jgi:hypothetical protein
MTDKELISEMFNRMDSHLKEQDHIQIMNRLKMYPCIVFMKEDCRRLVGSRKAFERIKV